jgi:hypothetical protein
MEVLLVVVGLVALFYVLKLIVFIPNKVYLEQVLGALRAYGAAGMADMLATSTSGKLGKDIAKEAWVGLDNSRNARNPAEECAAGMITDWQRN